jgi:hypothetical protein
MSNTLLCPSPNPNPGFMTTVFQHKGRDYIDYSNLFTIDGCTGFGRELDRLPSRMGMPLIATGSCYAARAMALCARWSIRWTRGPPSTPLHPIYPLLHPPSPAALSGMVAVRYSTIETPILDREGVPIVKTPKRSSEGRGRRSRKLAMARLSEVRAAPPPPRFPRRRAPPSAGSPARSGTRTGPLERGSNARGTHWSWSWAIQQGHVRVLGLSKRKHTSDGAGGGRVVDERADTSTGELRMLLRTRNTRVRLRCGESCIASMHGNAHVRSLLLPSRGRSNRSGMPPFEKNWTG